jgi:predicted small secreted protein
MKKIVLNLALVFAISVLMTSCYTLTYSVGEGAKTGVEVKEKNHYLIYGLAPVKTSDPTKMAGGAKDYTVTIQHTFVDGLLNALTGGIYTPTTTTVKKIVFYYSQGYVCIHSPDLF